MKKLILIVLSFLLTCTACASPQEPADTSSPAQNATGAFDLKGIWISCYEMDFGGFTEAEFRQETADRFSEIADFGLNAVFVHMRANSDAFYPSELFPWAKQMLSSDGAAPDYDPLAILIEEAHRLGLQIHAWINPYRVSAVDDDPAALSDGCPAKTWLTDGDPGNDDWAVRTGGGIYYNPAIPEVQRLILDGVREISDHYDVDGIHFDDYFYPTTDPEFDAAAYAEYCAGTSDPLPLDAWRRANVNTLVSAVYSAAKSTGKTFGISPAADISSDGTDRNYTEQYADIPYWMANGGYIDYIVPQLYFGFDYPAEDFRYDALLDQWLSLPRLPDVKLYIGLAAYKIGTEDAGSNEWMVGTDMLARQSELAKESGCDGIILFSYGSFASEEPLFRTQMENLRKTW